MNRYGRGFRWAGLLALTIVTAFGVSACSPGEESAAPPTSSRSSAPGGAAMPGGAAEGAGVADEAQAVLEGLFVGMEPIAGGSGGLQPQFGNTHPAVPDGVVSVTFAFTCTGGGEVKLLNEVGGKDVPSSAGAQACDGSLSQQSVEVPASASFGFTATPAAGAEDGGYAYAYYVEKEQHS